MTVRDAVRVLTDATDLKIGHSNSASMVSFDRNDQLMIAAYGDFEVCGISGNGNGSYEISISVSPVRKVSA